MPLSIQQELALLRAIPGFGSYLARALSKVETAVNGLAIHSASESVGTLPPPPPLSSVNVAHDTNNLVHVTLTDNNPLNKNVGYFVEYASEPGFLHPHVEDLRSSRGRVLNLPQGTYYIRGYHQPVGGLPSKPVNYGGSTPTAVTITSGSALALLPSAGSGTGAPDGSQGGSGLGRTLTRPAPGPKRTSGK
jgi:hypothetical protein